MSALAWVAQQASPVIAQTLAQVNTLDDIVISLPPVQDVAPGAMFPIFALALEHAYSGSAGLQASDVLPLWALAVALQVCDPSCCMRASMQGHVTLPCPRMILQLLRFQLLVSACRNLAA